jgi:hypothetical protein
MVRIAAHGLAIEVPRGWEARMWVPDLPAPAVNLPVLHLANFPLPVTRDTYAEELADGLRPGQVVASLAELASELAGRGLYAAEGVAPIRRDELDPRALQRQERGRLGLQRFFSMGGRAFSLYVMAREGPGLEAALAELDETLRSLGLSSP